MATTFNDIIDRAYSTGMTDYRLDMLIKKEPDLFYKWMSGFVMNAVDMFDGVLNENDLEYEEYAPDPSKPDEKAYRFKNALSSKQQYILMLGVVLGWYRKDLDDVVTFKAKLSNKDFKELSNAAHLNTRQERLAAMEETLSEAITSYQLNNIEKLPYFNGG